MKEIFRKLIPVICLVPLVVGMVGYLLSGEWISDALYASFALYFTNPVSEAYNGCIEFARWTAPLVAATAILCVLKSVWDGLAWRVAGVLQGVHVGGVTRCLRSSIFLVQLLEIGFQRFHILILLGAGDQRAGDACRSVAQNRVKNRVRGGAERQGWGGIPLVCRGRIRIFVALNQIVPLLLQIGLLGSIARCNGCVILCL